MRPHSTLERQLTEAMESMASTGAPDYLDDILGRSSRMRQRRAWPFQRSVFPARAPHERAGWWTGRSLMTPILRIAAVLLLVVGVAIVFGPLRESSRYGTADPSPSASPGPSAVPMRDGPLAAGTYTARPFALPGSDACGSPAPSGCAEAVRDDDIRVTFTLPDGWDGDPYGSVFLTGTDRNTPTWAAMIFERGAWLLTDPCQNAQGADIPVGPTVAEFTDALVAHPLLDVTTPIDITLDGYPGKYLELTVPMDIAACDVYRPWEPGIFARWPGEQWLLTVLNVDGLRVVIRQMVHEGTTPEVRAQLQGIVDSIAIDPATAPEASPSLAPLAWSPASIEQDWPAPVRAEPAGDPVLVEWGRGYTDPGRDIGSDALPWIDIVSVQHSPCNGPTHACVAFDAPAPDGPARPDDPWVAYGLVFDTDLDGIADVRLGMDRISAEGWAGGPGEMAIRAWQTDLRDGTTEFGRAGGTVCDCLFPGEQSGRGMAHFYPHQAIAGRFYAWASMIEDGRVVATDYAPDVGWLDSSAPVPPPSPPYQRTAAPSQ